MAGNSLICVDECQKYYVENEDDSMSKCVDKCPPKYNYISGNKCVNNCEYRIDGTTECLTGENLCQGDDCVTKCPASHPYEINFGNGSSVCVLNCAAHVPAMYAD